MATNDDDIKELYARMDRLERAINAYSKKVKQNEDDIKIIVDFCKSLAPLLNVIKKLKFL